MLIETVLSLVHRVCRLKHLWHRTWPYLQMHLAYVADLFNALLLIVMTNPWTVGHHYHPGDRLPELDARDPLVRANFLSLKAQDFVLAARALGVSDRAIIFVTCCPLRLRRS
jgi:hypothetical protein